MSVPFIWSRQPNGNKIFFFVSESDFYDEKIEIARRIKNRCTMMGIDSLQVTCEVIEWLILHSHSYMRVSDVIENFLEAPEVQKLTKIQQMGKFWDRHQLTRRCKNYTFRLCTLTCEDLFHLEYSKLLCCKAMTS